MQKFKTQIAEPEMIVCDGMVAYSFFILHEPAGWTRAVPKSGNGRTWVYRNRKDVAATFRDMTVLAWTGNKKTKSQVIEQVSRYWGWNISLHIKSYSSVSDEAGFNELSAKHQNKVKYRGKPDYDNIAKLIGDSLNGLAWKDDAHITHASCQKFGCTKEVYKYLPGPGVSVTITYESPELMPVWPVKVDVSNGSQNLDRRRAKHRPGK